MFEYKSGLIIGFILLACVTSWNLIGTKGRYALKCITILILVWYGLAVAYTVPNIMGWSAKKDLPPDAKIIGVKIIEDTAAKKGVMYFWLNEEPAEKLDFANLLKPGAMFLYTGKRQPRSYQIPYDRELHKKLIEITKKQKNNPGSLIMTGKKGIKGKQKKSGDNLDTKDPPFKILNPYELLPK